MIDLIHEILNDHLVVRHFENGSSIKFIKQEDLSKIAKEINEAIKKELK